MGWHTNWQNPGWRLYINYAEEPGKSFFRYRDPETGKIVTAIDREFNFRLFRVSEEVPFWHAVCSDTYRYSLGYKVVKAPKFFQRFRRKIQQVKNTIFSHPEPRRGDEESRDPSPPAGRAGLHSG
jgi:hypothetical protein